MDEEQPDLLNSSTKVRPGVDLKQSDADETLVAVADFRRRFYTQQPSLINPATYMKQVYLPTLGTKALEWVLKRLQNGDPMPVGPTIEESIALVS